MERHEDLLSFATSTPNTTRASIYQHAALVGMSALATILLVICALLAGLTLALCSLNLTWLEVMRSTGNSQRRKQAIAVARVKKRSSWMLCSLIICSVACGESLPIVIKVICHTDVTWIPIVISTLLIALFAEIIPQYTIPRHALVWSYYCRSIVWACMWITCIISYPLAWLLDRLSYRTDDTGIFTNAELGFLIKHHEKQERKGGRLDRETSRVMLGALKLGSSKLNGSATAICQDNLGGDLEKAEAVTARSLMITPWSAVKTVNINEQVNRTFINKITKWSYSRIPVIGNPDDQSQEASGIQQSSMIRVFGFLHVKNLIGLNVKDNDDPSSRLLVKDLSLYPLPIVRQDMAPFDLLNLFQLGMSRMALVIYPPSQLPGRARHQDDWTADFLEAARRSALPSISHRERIFGIRSPEPLGIITYEDIVQRILQRDGRDEKDFFEHGLTEPDIMEAKKTQGYNHSTEKDKSTVPEDGIALPKIGGSPILGSLRRRNVSRGKAKSRVDDLEKGICCTLDGVDERNIILSKPHKYIASTSSSYTKNSKGGFHNIDTSSGYSGDITLTHQNLTELGAYPFPFPAGSTSSLFQATSLLSRPKRPLLAGDLAYRPRLPRLCRVTPFSRQNYSSFERCTERQDEDLELCGIVTSPIYLLKDNTSDSQPRLENLEAIKRTAVKQIIPESCSREASGDTISFASWYYSDSGSQANTKDCAELGDVAETRVVSKKTLVPIYTSKTLPCMHDGILGSISRQREESQRDTRLRERSFHDDRAMLPSQHKNMASSIKIGARSTSLWF